MFHYCKKIEKTCSFSIHGIFCGLGKGESRIDDVKECNGKSPKYSKKFLDKLALENKNANRRESEQKSIPYDESIPLFQDYTSGEVEDCSPGM